MKKASLGATQLLLHHDPAVCIDAVNLEDGLGEIDPDRDNLHRGRLLHGWFIDNDHPMALPRPDIGAVHIINLMAPIGCRGVRYDRLRCKLHGLAPSGKSLAPNIAIGGGRDQMGTSKNGVFGLMMAGVCGLAVGARP